MNWGCWVDAFCNKVQLVARVEQFMHLIDQPIRHPPNWGVRFGIDEQRPLIYRVIRLGSQTESVSGVHVSQSLIRPRGVTDP